MPYVIDLTGKEYPLKATITNDGEVNGNQILSATIEFNSVNKAFIHNIGELWRIVDHDDVEHVIKYCRRRGVGDRMAVDIKGVPVFFDKLDNDRIYERIDKHMTASEAFTRIFENTGFTFVLVDSFAAVDWEGFGDGETKLESFKRALERYKCEFEIIGNTVYLRSQIGRDTSIVYRHKLNASNIVQEIDADELWTFARGYGDYGDGEGGEDWRDAKLIREYTSPLAKILGIRHAPPIKNGNIKDPAFMDAQLKALVDESLKISVSATIHDLRKQGYPYAQSQLGDRVFLIDERIGLNEEVRVVAQSITRDWKGNVIDINITFGSHSIVKRHQSSLQTAIKNITDLIEGRKKLPFNALDNAVMEATRALTRMQSQLQITENGSLLAVDKTNPNNLVILNAAGLGVSNDGGQTFGQAITGNGIVADYIVSGTLRGIYIEGVEINGSIFRSESGSNTYTQIQNAFVESRGKHTRTWRGKTSTHDIKLRMENGYFRARNDDMDWSLYFSDWGVSTYADGTGDNDASGYIEFHSPAYSPTNENSGLTIGSLAGRVAIETDNSRIYLNPNGASVRVADINDNYYSVYASQFNNASSVLYKTNISNLEVSGLEVVKNLRVVQYVYQSDVDNGVYDNWQVGVISELSPEIASRDMKAVNINKWLGYLTKAIQELSAENERLKKEIDDIYLILGGE